MATIDFDKKLVREWLSNTRSESPLNAIASSLLSQSRYRLALLVFTESLRLKPDQPEVRKQIIRLKPYAFPEKPDKLPEESCLVSVIMRTRNRTEEIRESIRSVLEQSLQDFELIIVNDGGTETIGEIASSFHSPKIRYVELNENRGPSGAMNAGLLNARGKYIAYLDDDDVFYPDHLETLVAFLESHGEYGCVYSNAWWCHGTIENGRFIEERREPGKHPPAFDKELFFRKNWIITNTLLYRRSVLLDVGLFNEDVWYSEDWEHFRRIAEHHEFYQLSAMTGEYRWKQDNASHREYLMDFHSTLIFRFNHFRMFDIIALEDSTRSLNVRETKEMFYLARENYDCYRNRPSAVKAIFRAHQFLTRSKSIERDFSIISDYFNVDPQDCLLELAKERQIAPLFRLAQHIVAKSAGRWARRSTAGQ